MKNLISRWRSGAGALVLGFGLACAGAWGQATPEKPAAPAPALEDLLSPDAGPVFTPSGIAGTIAPSGYAAGVSAEQTHQVLVRARALSPLLISQFLFRGAAPSCAEQFQLLHRAETSPGSADASEALGLFYLRHGEARESVRWLEQAARARPADIDDQVDLAVAYLSTGQPQSAEHLLHGVAQSGSTSARVHLVEAAALAGLARPGDAIAEYKLSFTLDGSEGNGFACGFGLVNLGEAASAEALFERALKTSPSSARLWLGLGVAQALAQNKGAAVRSLLKAVQLQPEDSAPYSFLAGLSGWSAATDREIESALSQRLALHADEAEAEYDYALALLGEQASRSGADRRQTIIEHLQAALRKDPNLTDAHLDLGMLFADNGDDRAAIPEFERAAELRTRDPRAHYRLAQAYRRQGHSASADRELQRFALLRAQAGDAEPAESDRVFSTLAASGESGTAEHCTVLSGSK